MLKMTRDEMNVVLSQLKCCVKNLSNSTAVTLIFAPKKWQKLLQPSSHPLLVIDTEVQ